MSSLAVWVITPYQRDELFKPESPMNRDNCLAPFHALKRELEKRGWSCHTQDHFQSRGERPTDVLFIDMPSSPPSSLLGEWASSARSHLLIQECEVVLPRNWDISLHENFESVFTWHPEFVKKGGRYREVNFSQGLHGPANGSSFESRKLCTLIAGNKGSSHPYELYSKRVEAIRFFEKHEPASFDLYGVGWDKLEQSNVLFKVLNKFPAIAKALAPKFPTYRGKVALKSKTLETYKFAICFENAREIPGYVTEKIFDCLMAGCLPVYWGAPDIADRIPRDCFIDFREFRDFSALVAHLKSFSAEDFERFKDAARAYLSSESARRYDIPFFANAIASRLTGS